MSRFVELFILMLVAVLVLAACGGGAATPAPPKATEAPAVEEPAAPEEPVPEAEATTEEEPVSLIMMENPPVTVLTQRTIEEVIGEKEVALAAVSPDGATIAWIKSAGGLLSKDVAQLCLYSFADAFNNCVDKPEEYASYPAQLAWSADSAYITFSENPIQLGDESDIWVFDVATSEFANLTDDGQYGPWSTMEAGTYALDYLPMWNAADGLIYFWRSAPNGELSVTFDLYRVSPEGGEAELARDLPESVALLLPLWNFEFFYMDGPWAIAPDGSKAAVIVRTVLEPKDAPNDGLWLFDLEDAEVEPQHLATVDDFQAAMPPWQEFPATPLALSWTSDSQGVVVLAQSKDLQQEINAFYYVDVESSEMSPVNDFSGVAEHGSYYVSDDPQLLPPMFYSPWTATISPAGDKLLMWNDLTGVSGMFVSMQPPDGSIPGLVHGSDYSTSIIRTRVSTGSDGKVIMYGLLLTVEEE